MSLRNQTITATFLKTLNASLPQNITNTITTFVSKALRNALPSHNASTKELIVLADPMPLNLEFNSEDIDLVGFLFWTAVAFTIVTILGIFFYHIISTYVYKEKQSLFNIFNWIRHQYKEYKLSRQTLPTVRPKKAKESPFVAPLPPPPVLPSCPRLDGAEKGQNIMFRVSLPYRRIQQQQDTLSTDDEHRITITTVVEGNGRPPLHPPIPK
jgi:hypothetical protein